VLAAAAAHPRDLVVGLDAVGPRMAESSRRAARPSGPGGHPNALFVVAAVETPPAELVGRADLVTVHFPWGSLLRGLLAADHRAAIGSASLLRADGVLEALVSIDDRDGLDELAAIVADRGHLEAAWSAHRLRLLELRPATGAEVTATGSTWAKRLAAASGRRAVTRLVLQRSRSMVG